MTDEEVIEVGPLVDKVRYLINLHPVKTYEMMKALGEPFRELTELGDAKLKLVEWLSARSKAHQSAKQSKQSHRRIAKGNRKSGTDSKQQCKGTREGNRSPDAEGNNQ